MSRRKLRLTDDGTYQMVYNDFVELRRTFRELKDVDVGDEDVVHVERVFGVGAGLSWSDIVKEHRVVILSEAGSGKTTEIQAAASKLKAEGRAAFFLRLERVAVDLDGAFEVGSREEFDAWLASEEDGWLFLDSVDEARLRSPRDFQDAIRSFAARIGLAKDRAHVLITSRTSAWRPKNDLRFCEEQLPHIGAVVTEDTESPSRRHSASTKASTRTRDRSDSAFKVVELRALTPDQVRAFAIASGVPNLDLFMEAIDRADAWSFTERPQDLQELAGFWIDHKAIGSRMELMRSSVDRRLMERDQNREEFRPIEKSRLYEGARLLAAAVALMQEQVLCVPDGADWAKGIVTRDVLSDWNETDRATLLQRPIFDQAIYGTLRFHHRTVREYLAADWANGLLCRAAPRRTMEKLFFRNQHGIDVVVPTLRPLLPWLVLWDQRIQDRVLQIAPEIVFEGGDPTQLPVNVRRKILADVCTQLATGAGGRSARDYAAVQRFASAELADDIRFHIATYRANDELLAFLIRMIWIGRIQEGAPEALQVALDTSAATYCRRVAIKALAALGATDKLTRVRCSFVTESDPLDRECLSELVEQVSPDASSVQWLIDCLDKIAPEQKYTVDPLSNRIEQFVMRLDLDLLSTFAIAAGMLLDRGPFLERRDCRVSVRYLWLLPVLCTAIQRLIVAKHSRTFEPWCLELLHKCSISSLYAQQHDMVKMRAELTNLLSEWPELNRELFWYEVHRARAAIEKTAGERLIDFWKAMPYGCLWRFGESDFDYLTDQVTKASLLDDRLVALSLAFVVYRGKTPRQARWRKKLNAATVDNEELTQQLYTYFHPPAPGPEARRFRRQQADWKKRDEADRVKVETHHAGWKTYFQESLEKERRRQIETPGTLSNAIYYLFEQSRRVENSSSRWTQYNWRSLVPQYGEEVALLYRDGCTAFWRHHSPTLRSEGAQAQQTTVNTIIGLTGLEIEAHEVPAWPAGLSNAEAVLACRHASFELNGFPTWFPKLFTTHASEVTRFLLQEIRFELRASEPGTDTHYILDDVTSVGQWAWNALAPEILLILKENYVVNLSSLEQLIRIVQGSNLPDDAILEATLLGCRRESRLDHLACWLAMLAGVNAEQACEMLQSKLRSLADVAERTVFAMVFITHLCVGRRGDPGVNTREAFKRPAELKAIYLLMHEHIRMTDDIDRLGKGVYSPDLRDHAQNARERLLDLLMAIPGKETFQALTEIANCHPNESARGWMLQLARERAEKDAEMAPWTCEQLRDFNDELEQTPRTHRELADLAESRLIDLKDDWEEGDSSIAGVLQGVTKETTLRNFIANTLREKAHGRYTITQEEELADAKRPDIRFDRAGVDAPVPMELKLADNGWSGQRLFERLENQLCGDYLRDVHSGRGLFVIVTRGSQQHWNIPGHAEAVDFNGLTKALQDHWREISARFPHLERIDVVGIDLTKRLRPPRT